MSSAAPSAEAVLKQVYVFKQLLAVALGCLWGVVGLEGGIGFFSFFPALAGGTFIYVTKVLQLNDEDVGRSKLLSEGFMPSVSVVHMHVMRRPYHDPLAVMLCR